MAVAVDVALPPPAAEDISFAGDVTIGRRIHVGGEDGFAILAAERGDGSEVVIAGEGLAHLELGDAVRVQGEWRAHRRHGRQVQVTFVEHVDPVEELEQVAFLASLPGVGRTTAKRLVDEHGELLFARLDEDPDAVFAAVPRFPRKKAAAAAQAWRDRRGDRGLYVLLASFRLARLVKPLSDRHGDGGKALAALRADPYALVTERGVGFDTADRLAAHLGIAPQSRERVEAALLQALRDAESDGHTYLPMSDLLRRAAALVGPVSVDRVGGLELRKRVVCDGDRVWRAQTVRRERLICERLADLLLASARREVAVPATRRHDVSTEQWTAVRRCFSHGVSVLVGGPGTGKTSSVRAIVSLAETEDLRIALAAPTGRAARRLEQATGHPAQTVHRLLGWSREGPSFNREQPLDCDLLVLDEASMCDLQMTAHLLAAVPDGCRVLIVGDSDQLPSVGAGRVLADVIASERVPVTRLTQVFRQAARSQIVRVAHAVNRGAMPELGAPADPDAKRDFFFLEQRDAWAIGPLVCELVGRRLPAYYDADPLRDITVLAPSKKGPAGANRLNELLASRLNPYGVPAVAGVRVGDKVMWTVNDVDLNLMNGTTLVVESDHPDRKLLLCRDEDDATVAIPYDQARHLAPAMAITTHKSQGSEIPIAVVVLHRNGTHPALLCRPLLYTAITRAKLAAVIVGERQALSNAIARAQTDHRYSGLAERLRASLPC